MATSEVEAKFHQEMLAIYDRCAEYGYRPTQFRRMVDAEGGVKLAKRLIHQPEQSGLRRLAELGQVQLSMECLMLKEDYQSLFAEDEIRLARMRVRQ